MADDTDSIFAKAGFDVPKAPQSTAAPVSSNSTSPSIFEAAGFSLPGTKAAEPTEPSWKDAEALENMAALGIKPPEPPAKPGRGVWQALKDYPGHLLHGLVDTVAAPGNILASGRDYTSTELIPTAVGIAGLATGSEFPKIGASTIAEKIAPSSQAVNKLVEAIGPENVPAAVNRLTENPRLTLADVSDPVRTMAQGLIDPAQPKAQNAIVSAVKERAATRPEAVNSAFTEAMGAAPDVPKMVEGLKQRASDVGKTLIQPAVKDAKPVDVTPVIQSIDKEIATDPVGKATLRSLKAGEEPNFPLSDYQRRLFELRQDLRGSWKDRDQMFLDAGGEQGAHWLQTRLRAEAQNLLSSASGADRNLGGRLMNMRNKLVDQIDEASGGAYKPALSKFRDVKQIDEAFESGFDTLKNRSGLNGALEDSPQAFRDWMKNATPEEVVARRLGTRADIDQKINSVKNGSLKGETITSIPYNQEKLRALFGDKEANRLIRVMKDSADESATNAKMLLGSKTAETLAGQKALEVPKVAGGNPLTYVAPVAAEILGQSAGFPLVGMAGSLAARGVHMGIQKASQMNALARNAEFAKNALATGAGRQETIRALLSHPKVVRQLKKSSNALTAP